MKGNVSRAGNVIPSMNTPPAAAAIGGVKPRFQEDDMADEQVALALVTQRLDQTDKTLGEIKRMLEQSQERDEKRHEALDQRVNALERCGSLAEQDQARAAAQTEDLEKRVIALEKATLQMAGTLNTLVRVLTWAGVTFGGAVAVWLIQAILRMIGGA